MSPLLGLWATLARSTGPVRPLLVVAATAPVAALALVAVSVARLSAGQVEQGSNLLTDPDLRGGYVFALALISLAPLALLVQSVRLGSSSTERRLAALRVAGATPGDVRRLAALDVALPAVVGAVVGLPLYVALRSALGGITPDDYLAGGLPSEFRVIPTSVGPTWWDTVLVVAVLGAVGALVGARSLGPVVAEPLGTTREVARRAPRPTSLLLLVPAAACLALAPVDEAVETIFFCTALGLAALALLGLGPSVAHLIGRRTLRRAASAPDVLAASRLLADPRATGRAAATVSVISFAAGISAWFLDAVNSSGNDGDLVYVAPLVLVLAVLAIALVMVAVSLAVHAAETATDRKRATAALSAQGAGPEVVVAAHRREIELVVIPLTLIGVLLGSVPTNLLAGLTGQSLLIMAAFIAATVGLAWVATRLATALARPAILRACSLENLRNG